jgi:sulfide:quinone oxidoreductase
VQNEVVKEILKEVDKHPEIMSRRDVLKYLALSPLATSINASMTATKGEFQASNAKEKIVIVGGGLAGISTAARLKNTLDNPDITIIEPEPLSASYQSGLTLVAAGLWSIHEIQYRRDDKIPHGVKLIKGRATTFDPKNNKLTVDDKEQIEYDQLIIATGITLNYSAIKGLTGEVTSFAKNTNVLKKSGLTKNGLHSIFFQDGASATWDGIKELIQKAKIHTSTTKLQAIFTHPNTDIKCESASKSIMYLTHSRLVEAGVRDKVEMIFNTDADTMHDVTEFHNAIRTQFKRRNFTYNYTYNLIELDVINKVATFDKHPHEAKHEKIEVSYDFIHITPPMKVHDEIAHSSLGSQKGFIPVNRETLQHLKFDNVWSLGDVASIPLGKSSASVTSQHKVLVDNIIAHMQKKDSLPAKYTGYTLCPFITSVGTAMLAEYDWEMKPKPSFPLSPTQERWIWWLMEIYVLKTITISGIMKGYA